MFVAEGKLYRYDQEAKQWSEYGQLPDNVQAPFCALFQSGELMLIEGKENSPQSMWIRRIE